MTHSPNNIDAIRRALLEAGVRTVGFTFDGYGDEGSVLGTLVPETLDRPLAEYGDDLTEFQYSSQYNVITKGFEHRPSYTTMMSILSDVGVSETVLNDLAYEALEHFHIDWMNDQGAYGTVAIDLLTGDFVIDAEERVQTTTPARQKGQALEPVVMDFMSHITHTLR
jgi:hypothetical protein